MLISEKVARTKWCPFVRVDESNRHNNTMTDGFENAERVFRCIASDCMGWRQFHLSHLKGGEDGVTAHGYCGYAGKPELD